jgi:hypothetical protein
MAKTDQLNSSIYFSTPVYSIEIPEWVNHVDKVCDKYIKAAKDNNKKAIIEREKELISNGTRLINPFPHVHII